MKLKQNVLLLSIRTTVCPEGIYRDIGIVDLKSVTFLKNEMYGNPGLVHLLQTYDPENNVK